MTAPAITLAAIAKLKPCKNALADARARLPARRKITAAQARDAGVSFHDILWVISSMACMDKDVERRRNLWIADCAARVLHIYEKTETGDAPRQAIIAGRQYARGEIDIAALDTAWAATWTAAGAASTAAAAGAAAGAPAGDAERAWQFNHLIARFSDNEPEDWPLPERQP